MHSAVQQEPSQAQMKKTDLASSIGAGILGVGIGILTAPYLGAYAIPLAVIGAIMHIWGMQERHRLDAQKPKLWWTEALYWLCWAILLGIGALILMRL